MILLAALVGAASVRGVVRDTQCEPLPGVTVVIRDAATQRIVITNAAGEFAFDNLPDTSYTLQAWLQGFQVLSRKNVRPTETPEPFPLMLPVGFLAIVEQVVTGVDAKRAAAPDGFSIRVTDENCHPVGNAAVTTTIGTFTRTLTTDQDGRAPLPDVGAQPFDIGVAAPGFSRSVLSANVIPRFRTEILMPLFRGPPDRTTVFDPSPPPRYSVVEPVTDPRIRIVAMGDSTTAGTPAFKSPREAPPNGDGDVTSQYAYWLMQAHPDWAVVNQGVNGERSDEIAARFEQDVIARKPVVVVIIAGVNDVYQGRTTEHVETQLAAMYRRAREAGIRVVAGTIIPYNTATTDQNARMSEINAWIRAQADAGAVTFADTRAAVAAPGSRDVLASSPDGLHPDAAGYHRMAEAIAPAIERALHSR
jgi:lysophospholipase L1-like esterase